MHAGALRSDKRCPRREEPNGHPTLCVGKGRVRLHCVRGEPLWRRLQSTSKESCQVVGMKEMLRRITD